VTADHYTSRNPHFCKSALARFTPRAILALVEKHHIAYYEKEAGQIFCVKSSREIVAMLEQECRQAGVEIRLKCHVTEIKRSERFAVVTNQGEHRSESLVIATGGLSYSNLGATGFGHEVARKFGLKVTQLRPALVPFIFQERDRKVFQNLAGISIDAAIICGGRRFRGNILFTHKGLSGPAALQASLYWSPGETLLLDIFPGKDIFDVFTANRRSKMEMHNMLAKYFPKRLAQTWCDRLHCARPINQCSDRDLKAFANAINAMELLPGKTEGYATAEVTNGGVDTDELSSKSMEAKSVSGLYFIGEVVDVTGELGGYNLHWAWASGYAAGQFA
jgi:predicted Rossmann fold flavoprotein